MLVSLLAFVWITLPLHHCNVAGAADQSVAMGALAVTKRAHCDHMAQSTLPAQNPSPSCLDLGKAGPDTRHSAFSQPPLVFMSFLPLSLFDPLAAARPTAQEPATPFHRDRPLHLRKSVLLI